MKRGTRKGEKYERKRKTWEKEMYDKREKCRKIKGSVGSIYWHFERNGSCRPEKIQSENLFRLDGPEEKSTSEIPL
jgi:hypothetical protein